MIRITLISLIFSMFGKGGEKLMKTLNIHFNHPVNGKLQLRKKGSRTVKNSLFKTDKDFFVELDTSDLTAGEWTACFEWNYDNQPFFLERHFKIKDRKINPLTSKGSAPTEPASS